METPILFIIFNRPETTRLVFESIRKMKPKILFVAADGPRKEIIEENEICKRTRDVIQIIDWECNIKTLFHETNLGCYRAVNEAITWFFNNVEQGIILEDDCLPTSNFFKFMEWGLEAFKDNHQIGMISGSNLIDYKILLERRNGYSQFINIWGWASWKSVWQRHNVFLTIYEVQRNQNNINTYMNFNWWQKIYWHELFKYTIYLGSTWDFQLQYTFFKMNLLSVYPCKNLIFNIGFSGKGTHTKINTPSYIHLSKPVDDFDINMYLPVYEKCVHYERDFQLAKEIWHYNWISAFKLKIMNLYRLNH